MAENNKDVGITVEARMAVSYDKDGSPSCVLMQASLDFESEPDLDEIGNKIESDVRKWMENQGAENVKVRS